VKRILIVGAGFAGLASANLEPQVIEATPWAGVRVPGLCRNKAEKPQPQ